MRAATHRETNLRVAIKVVTLPEEDAHLARLSWGAAGASAKASFTSHHLLVPALGDTTRGIRRTRGSSLVIRKG